MADTNTKVEEDADDFVDYDDDVDAVDDEATGAADGAPEAGDAAAADESKDQKKCVMTMLPRMHCGLCAGTTLG